MSEEQHTPTSCGLHYPSPADGAEPVKNVMIVETVRGESSGNRIIPGAMRGRRPTREQQAALYAVLADLRRHVPAHKSSDHEAAMNMAVMAIQALVTDDPRGLDHARRWKAWCMNADPDSNTLAILEIANAVWVIRHIRHDPRCRLEVPSIASQVREQLAARFGETVPSADAIQGWVDLWVPHHAKGKVTTEGIVAKIIHKGRLLGYLVQTEGQITRTVTNVLRRYQGRTW